MINRFVSRSGRGGFPRFTRSPATAGSNAILPQVALHSRTVFYGDSTNSEAGAPGECNYPTQALVLMGGRLRGSVGWMQAVSGGDLETTYARRAYTIAQNPNLIIIGSMGALPEAEGITLLKTDPDTDSRCLDRWKRNVQAVFDGIPGARVVVALTLASSTDVTATRTKVWTAQRAFIAGLGPRAVLWDHTAIFDPATHATDGIHPNAIGGNVLADSLFLVIDPLVVSATRDDILGLTAAPAATTIFGTNVDTDWGLPGTTGSRTGTEPATGVMATGRTLLNNLVNGSSGTTLAVVGSKSTVGSYERQIVTVSGQPQTIAAIRQSDSNLVTPGGIPGKYFEALFEIIVDNGSDGAPVGMRGWTCSLGGRGGAYGSLGSTLRFDFQRPKKLDGVFRVPAKPIWASSTTNQVLTSAIDVQWKAQELQGRIIVSRPIIRQVELIAYAKPMNLSDDNVTPINFRTRISAPDNTAAVGAVGTQVRGQPGNISGGDLTFAPQWLRNGVAIPGATDRLYTPVSADAGTNLTFRPNPTNSFGAEDVPYTSLGLDIT